jgi:hypothetical protein
MPTPSREFEAVLVADRGERVYLELPFDPAEAWGPKERHHVRGTVAGWDFRGPVDDYQGSWRIYFGPAWLRDKPLAAGDRVLASLIAEGPQRDDLPADLAEALATEPEAGAFFDSLATFYRKGYLRWLEGSARRPAVRAERVREWIELLKAGKKTRDR